MSDKNWHDWMRDNNIEHESDIDLSWKIIAECEIRHEKEISKLKAENEKLREYVEHNGICLKWEHTWHGNNLIKEKPCTCGLDKLLKGDSDE